jgi:ascorbate PTS system EIIA or EIIAB component
VISVLDVEFGVHVDGWQAAIRAACQPLLDGGAVEKRYVDRCIEMVLSHGPYIVVAPGIALAHARPEDGVSALGLAVATLVETVEFGHPENDPVDLVFAFASPDNDQHVRLLKALAEGIEEGLGVSLRQSVDARSARAVLEEVLVGV